MEKNNLSVGLDIGTTKIVAMVGIKNSFNKLEIIGVGKSKSLGVHRGVVNNITQTIQSVNVYLKGPTYTETLLHNQENTTFPAITICPLENGYNEDALKVNC